MSSSSAFRSIVRIQTPPRYDPATGSVVPGALFGFDSSKPAVRDPRDPANALLSIKTSKRLDQPCGRFSLNFAPLEVEPGLFWSDILPAYSLVEIFLQRYPDPEPRLVMIGLVDRGEVVEDFSAAAPHRQVTVHGREAGCIFVDQKTVYMPAPPVPVLAETIASESPRIIDELPKLYGPEAQLLGMFAIDPEIALEGSSPVDAIDRFIKFVLEGLDSTTRGKISRAVPMLDMQLPKRSIADLIVFDRKKADRWLFDPTARLPASSQELRSDISIWEMAETWCDPAYQELWTRTVEDFHFTGDQPPPPRRNVVEVVFRRKPFAGRILSRGVVEVAPVAGSQFLEEFVADPAENIALDSAHVISRSSGWDAARTRNFFYVYPQTPILDVDYRSMYNPVVDTGAGSPADIRRLGLRSMRVADYYFGEGPSTAIEIGRARAKLLWAWHRFDGVMKSGTLQVVGDPKYEVGKRLVEIVNKEAQREAYITGVSHAVLLASNQPAFRTSIQFERGWPLR